MITKKKNKILSFTQGNTGIPACDSDTDKNVCATDYLQNPQKQAKVKECKSQINQMGYELYDLIKEEKISLIKRNRSSLSEGLDSSSVTIIIETA